MSMKKGGHAAPKVKPAKVSPHTGSKTANNKTPTTAQTHRGTHSGGQGGPSGGFNKPKPFKA